MLRLVLGSVLLLTSTFALTSTGADARPDFSDYLNAGELVAVVQKADAKSVTIRISWYQSTGGNNRNNYPRVGANGRVQRNRGNNNNRNRRPQMKEQHKDYTFAWTDNGLARWYKLGPKLDANGKKVDMTPKERDALKAPQGVPGWSADRSEISAGQRVELFLVRPKSTPLSKTQIGDLKIKYAVILGVDNDPSAPESSGFGTPDDDKPDSKDSKKDKK